MVHILFSGYYHYVLMNELVYSVSGDQVPIMYPDNRSAIQLAECGPGVVSRSRHFQVRYFYVKELIDSNSLQLVHLPTEQMHADFLTKPNQGKMFLHVRVWFLLGYDLQGESYRHRVFLQLITWFPCMYILLTDRPLFCFHTRHVCISQGFVMYIS